MSNNRIYPKGLLDKAIRDFEDDIRKKAKTEDRRKKLKTILNGKKEK